MSMFWSSALRLMPPQHHERVGKWTHEPRSNLSHKKHLFDEFIHSFIFNIILFRKYKNIFTFLHTQSKPKNIITTSYLLYCIVIYFTVLHIIFYFLLTFTPCAWQSLGGVGDTRTRKLFCRLLEEEWRELLRLFPRVQYKPRVHSWGKFTLATTLCTWSPNLAHLLSVISYNIFYYCNMNIVTRSYYNTNIGYIHHGIFLMVWFSLSIRHKCHIIRKLIISWPMS
jgi:hypothetical protein